MSDDRPLHVRVAEALGCRPEPLGAYFSDVIWGCTCASTFGPFWPHAGPQGTRGVRHYDTDWSATGPLIERYGITLTDGLCTGWGAYTHFEVAPYEVGIAYDELAEGPTPLIAVCNLILALKAAGKL